MVLVVVAALALLVGLGVLGSTVAGERSHLGLVAVAATGALVVVGLAVVLGLGVDTSESPTGGSPVDAPRPASQGEVRPSYDGARLAGGLAAAGGCLLVAVVLWRRTDWTPPGGRPLRGHRGAVGPPRRSVAAGERMLTVAPVGSRPSGGPR